MSNWISQWIRYIFEVEDNSAKHLSNVSVVGDRNTIASNIQNSTVTINNTKELEGLIQKLHDLAVGKEVLQVIVIASDEQDLPPTDNCPQERYGATPEDWKPYGNKTIKELLLHFQKESGLDVDIWFVNQWQTTSKDWTIHFQEDTCPHTILIVDAFSLSFQENLTFAQLFNGKDIGGFLMPVCKEFSQEQKTMCLQYWQKFHYLETCWDRKYNKPYMHIDLAVPYENLLCRRLADIAFTKLNIKPSRKGLSYLQQETVQANIAKSTSDLEG